MNTYFIDGVCILFVGFITFVLRAAARFGRPVPYGSDVYAHLSFTGEVRRKGHHIPKQFSRILTGGYFCVPAAMYWFTSFIPKKLLERVEPYWSAAIDTIQSIIIYFMARLIFKDYLVLDLPTTGAFIAGLTFATTPVLIRLTAGQFFMSGRPLGNLFFTCAAFIGLLYMWTGNLWWLLAVIPFLTLACMSSKFTVQNVILIALLVWVFGGWWQFLLLFIFSELLAVCITGGQHLRVLQHQFGHLWLYATRIQFKHASILANPSLTDRLWSLIRRGGASPSSKSLHPDRPFWLRLLVRVGHFFQQTPELVGLSHTPMLLLLVCVLVRNDEFLADPIYKTLAVWVVFGVLLTVLISFRGLRFLGEPDRYLGYIVFPLSVLIAFHVVRGDLNPVLYGIIIALGLLIVASNIFLYRKTNKRLSETDPVIDIAHVIQKMEPTHIMCIPSILAKELIYRVPAHRYLCFCGYNLGSTPETNEEFDFIFTETYPYPRTDLKALVDRYQCTVLIANLREMQRRAYDLIGWRVAYQNRELALYEFMGKA